MRCDVMSGMDVGKVDVTVVGGHAGTTIMPLLSQVHYHTIIFSPVSHIYVSLHAAIRARSTCTGAAERARLLFCCYAPKRRSVANYHLNIPSSF